jgi:hypothetical protein
MYSRIARRWPDSLYALAGERHSECFRAFCISIHDQMPYTAEISSPSSTRPACVSRPAISQRQIQSSAARTLQKGGLSILSADIQWPLIASGRHVHAILKSLAKTSAQPQSSLGLQYDLVLTIVL